MAHKYSLSPRAEQTSYSRILRNPDDTVTDTLCVGRNYRGLSLYSSLEAELREDRKLGEPIF
ncbi:hypothetical protein ANO14919_084050 [Xylariales sp. No.14919]|nr:hypothetical protein ANO14919_084050 [Xylariales sp. No.14919]